MLFLKIFFIEKSFTDLCSIKNGENLFETIKIRHQNRAKNWLKDK